MSSHTNRVKLTLRPVKLRHLAAQHLGASWSVIAINILVLFVACLLIWVAVDWAIVTAVAPWTSAAQCAESNGACWPFLLEKAPLVLFGTFPYEERWRPALVSLILISVSLVALFQWLNWRLQVVGWFVAIACFGALMGRGIAGLSVVPNAQWNGLPVLLLLGACSFACALPVGLSLALARQSKRAWLSHPAVVVIETLRGIPMVAVLFFGVFVLPLVFSGWRLSPVHAALIVLIAFHGAYVVEDFRTGFMAVGSGQWDAFKAV